jgi:glyoxylase-like metal-dependent hydrolase (beta-lactamase superfamily II)
MKAPIARKLGFVNCYLVGDVRFALVDAGYPGSEERLEACVRDAGVDPGRISLIVVTHAHLDHYGSAAALRRRWRVPVACSREDAGDIESGVNRHLVPLGVSGRFASVFARAAASRPSRSRDAAFAADILFSGAVSLSPWGVDASVVPCPGHTPGSIAVVPGAGTADSWESAMPDASFSLPWAIVGDLAFGRFAAPGRARLPLFAADRFALAGSLAVFARAQTVYVGHGGPLSGRDLGSIAASARG